MTYTQSQKLAILILFLAVLAHNTSNAFISTKTDTNLTDQSNSFRLIKRNFKRNTRNDGYSIVPRDYYQKPDYNVMLSHIFEAVKFENIQCEYTFQNCLLNMNNEKNVRGYNILSKKCFPLQKSRYCLEEVNFRSSDCIYKMAEVKIRQHFQKLTKNLETCVAINPNVRLSELTASNKSSRSIFQFQHILFVLFILIFVLISLAINLL